MKKFIAPTFAAALAASAAAGIGAANAGEPVTLTAAQMDGITAGHGVHSDFKKHGIDFKKDKDFLKKLVIVLKKHDIDFKKDFFKKHRIDFKKDRHDFKKHGH